jgi:hypothetical protein
MECWIRVHVFMRHQFIKIHLLQTQWINLWEKIEHGMNCFLWYIVKLSNNKLSLESIELFCYLRLLKTNMAS